MLVDLNNIWHTNKTIPDKTRKIVAIKSTKDNFIGTCTVDSGMYQANISSGIVETAFWNRIKMWAYLDDLLPNEFINSNK